MKAAVYQGAHKLAIESAPDPKIEELWHAGVDLVRGSRGDAGCDLRGMVHHKLVSYHYQGL